MEKLKIKILLWTYARSCMHFHPPQQGPIKCFTADNVMCSLSEGRQRTQRHLKSDKGRCRELVNLKPSRKPISIKTATLFRPPSKVITRSGAESQTQSTMCENSSRPSDRTH